MLSFLNEVIFVRICAQRLSGSGYCFSAALPPFLASAGIAAVEILEDNPQLLSRLHRNISIVHSST
jgi:serine palmitoyltransferase